MEHIRGSQIKIKDEINVSVLKSKNRVTLLVNYSYNSYYDFHSSENTYSKQKVMCPFLILYGVIKWKDL